LKIAHISAECTPLIKVGGLGEVVGGLTKALDKDTILILPKYRYLKIEKIKNLRIFKKNLLVSTKKGHIKTNIYKGYINNIEIYLIDPKNQYFEKKRVYGYKIDIEKFLFFSKASCLLLKELGDIDIAHIHDWHVAFMAPIIKENLVKTKVKKVVLSIHNLGYQGICRIGDVDKIGYDGKYFLDKNKLKHYEGKIKLNLLKGGIVYSDFIIPVSNAYAKEILNNIHGGRLSEILQTKKNKIKGIVNGIDSKSWNPEFDEFLFHKFSKKMPPEKLIKIKEENKKFLIEKFHLHKGEKPLIGYIGRLVVQKGPKIIKHAIKKTLSENGRFVLLGTPLDTQSKKIFKNTKHRYAKSKNAVIDFSFNEKLSHQLFAALDFIIIPSLFEPCGLTQLIAFKYGVMPIVRKTGGLSDTVFDIDSSKEKNGFTFNNFSTEDFDKTLERALHFFKNKKEEFYKIIHKNMFLDYTWETISKEYVKIYKKLIKQKTF